MANTRQLLYTARIDSIDHQELASRVGELQGEFVYSSVLQGHQRTQNLSQRNSRTLKDINALRPYTTQILAAVRQHWPEILKALELRKFLIYSYNMGCIAYENGGFFKRHIDHSPFAFCPRRLTWIYYFFKEPKGFDGGDLIFYGREKEEIRITPYSGLLVAFGPHMEHEATTVTVTNSDFKSSRFSFTSFVAGYPSLQSAVSSTLYQIDARYPSTQVVTRPLITTARRIVRAQKRAKGTDVHQ